MRALLVVVLLCVGIVFGGDRYFVPKVKGNWFYAREFCISLDMRLAHVPTKNENDALIKYLTASDKTNPAKVNHYWIGLSDLASEGTFRWNTNGKDSTFTSWGQGEPNDKNKYEDCVDMIGYISTKTGRWSWVWNDNWCEQESHFVCESFDPCIEEFI